jgi:phage host-nuclease inhibitor protein Gam
MVISEGTKLQNLYASDSPFSCFPIYIGGVKTVINYLNREILHQIVKTRHNIHRTILLAITLYKNVENGYQILIQLSKNMS